MKSFNVIDFQPKKERIQVIIKNLCAFFLLRKYQFNPPTNLKKPQSNWCADSFFRKESDFCRIIPTFVSQIQKINNSL